MRSLRARPGITLARPIALRYVRRFAAGGRGEIGRHARFRFWWRKPWGFKSLRPHHTALSFALT